jgi:hypothetical protein
MTKNDFAIVGIMFGVTGIVATIAFIGYVAIRPDIPEADATLTQELIDGPIPLVISCKEQRGAYHKLICGVNGDVKGRWLVRERVDGELRRGSESVFAFNEWEMAVGSDVSPTILIQFIPTGLQQGISLEYRLDTAYMRKGVQNFAGVNI